MDMYRAVTLGDLLRERRTTLGLTMREVAGSTLSPTAVNNIEKGKINPTIDTVLYLCQVLQLQPEKVLLFYPDFAKTAGVLFTRIDEMVASGETDDALTLLYDMYWVAAELPDHEQHTAEIQFKISQVFADNGRFDSATTAMTDAYKLFILTKNYPRQVDAVCALAVFSKTEGQLQRALGVYTTALELAYRHQLFTRVTSILMEMAQIHMECVEQQEAIVLCNQAELVYDNLRDAEGKARAKFLRAQALAEIGKLQQALEAADAARSHFQATGDQQRLTEASRLLGEIYSGLHDYAQAREHYLQALALAESAAPDELHRAKGGLASLSLQQQEPERAREHALEALSGLQQPRDRSKLYCILAGCDLQDGNTDGYKTYMHQAVTTLQEAGDTCSAALIQCELADQTDDLELLRDGVRKLRQVIVARKRI
ncbi:DNA-binding XRE family transcriptional regulator [Tumebacillus sp. BK434]|nr:DNA-binding XRE family transcriptional regulator [Tumebacillus sp. BK434]